MFVSLTIGLGHFCPDGKIKLIFDPWDEETNIWSKLSKQSSIVQVASPGNIHTRVLADQILDMCLCDADHIFRQFTNLVNVFV